MPAPAACSLFTINLASLTPGNGTGMLEGFDNTRNYSWEFVRTSDGIIGINISGFQNDVAGGSFQVVQAGNSLLMNFNSAAAVPEPSTLALLSTGLLPLGSLLFRKRQKEQPR